MRLKIDHDGATRFVEVAAIEDRRYYTTLRDDVRAILVCRERSLPEHIGYVVDANVGWDRGTRGFVLESREGQRHTKVTIYRRLAGSHFDRTLGGILAGAPSRDTE